MEFSQNRSTSSLTEVSSSSNNASLKITCSNIETNTTKRNITFTTDLKVILEKKLSDELLKQKNSNFKKLKKDLEQQENIVLNRTSPSVTRLAAGGSRTKIESATKWSPINAPPKIITSSHSGFNKAVGTHSPSIKSFRVESNLSLNYNPSSFSLNSSCTSSATSLTKKKYTIDDIKFSINDDQLEDLKTIMKGLFDKVALHLFVTFLKLKLS